MTLIISRLYYRLSYLFGYTDRHAQQCAAFYKVLFAEIKVFKEQLNALLEHIKFSAYDPALDAQYTACIIEQYYDNVLNACRTAVDKGLPSASNNSASHRLAG